MIDTREMLNRWLRNLFILYWVGFIVNFALQIIEFGYEGIVVHLATALTSWFGILAYIIIEFID